MLEHPSVDLGAVSADQNHMIVGKYNHRPMQPTTVQSRASRREEEGHDGSFYFESASWFRQYVSADL